MGQRLHWVLARLGHDFLALNDALQVIHGSRGYDFKLQYFGNKLRQEGGSSAFWPNQSGRVETILFQHKVYSNGILNRPIKSPGAMLALFAMYSHAYSPPTQGTVETNVVHYGPFAVSDNKLKFGSEFQYQFLRNISAGIRFDRVQPTQLDKEQSYSALTLTATILSDWNSSRRIITSYTRYFLGADCFPDSPYSSIQHQADPNLFMVSALMSL